MGQERKGGRREGLEGSLPQCGLHNTGSWEASGSAEMLPIPDEKRDRVPFRRVSEKARVQEIRRNVHVKSDLADSEGSFEVLMAPQMAALEAYSSQRGSRWTLLRRYGLSVEGPRLTICRHSESDSG